jgi:hypothetical protein
VLRANARPKQPFGRLVLEKMRYQIEPLINKAQAIEHHRFDRLAHRYKTPFLILRDRPVNHCAYP